MIENKKASVLLVLKVLEKYSDEDHFLTYQNILDKIYQEYNIQLERKSIANCIFLLEELNYDIVKKRKQGVALFSRNFDDTEASYLIDAIFSSRSIDAKEAKVLIEKVLNEFSIYKRKDYSYLYKTYEINRTKNKDIMYNISIILEAIKSKKRIQFQVLDYDKEGKEIKRLNGFIYKVSPYYLINNYGRYYLLCNYRADYKTLNTFRIDYLKNVEIMDDDKYYTPLFKLDDDKYKKFSISKYINEHIYFYSGEIIEAKVLLKNEKSVLYIKDWFNESAKIKNEDGKIYAYIKGNETAIYFWSLQYLESVIVISPQSLKTKIINTLKNKLSSYQEIN